MRGAALAALALAATTLANDVELFPAPPERQRDKRSPEDSAARIAAAQAKRERKAAKLRATLSIPSQGT